MANRYLKYVGPTDGSAYFPDMASSDYEDANDDEIVRRLNTGWWVETDEKGKLLVKPVEQAVEAAPAPVVAPVVEPVRKRLNADTTGNAEQ